MNWNLLWHQAMIHSTLGILQTKRGGTVSFDIPIRQDGCALRLKLENSRKMPLSIERIGLIYEGEKHAVCQNGAERILIPGRSQIYSDEVKIPIKRETVLTVRIYCKHGYRDGNAIEEYAAWYQGDATSSTQPIPMKRSSIEERTHAYPWIPCIVQVEELCEQVPCAIAAFGDSITAMNRWVKPLAKRLDDAYGASVSIINSGISGNCLGFEPNGLFGSFYGVMGKKRYVSDVLELPNVKTVILAFGINDISYMTEKNSSLWNLDALKEAESWMIHEFHRHGLRVVGMTLGPRKGFGKWDAKQEAIRQQYNEWLRGNHELDALVDPEPLLLKQGTTDTFADELHQGDFLHPNAVGGQIIADTFDLAVLLGKENNEEGK